MIFSLAWNIIFANNLKVLVLKFLGMKNMIFLSQKVDGNMIFTDYWKGLVLDFSVMGNTVFFESRSSWKHDIYWLLRSSCFELFGDGKYSLFSAKNLMGRWYLHGLFELSMIFQDLGNMVFRAVWMAWIWLSRFLKSSWIRASAASFPSIAEADFQSCCGKTVSITHSMNGLVLCFLHRKRRQ